MRSADATFRALVAAVDLLRGERVDEAEAALREILRRWPDLAEALHFLGVMRHAQGRADEAAGLIRRSLAVVPSNASVWNNPSTTLIKQGRVHDGLMAHGKAMVLRPNDTQLRQEVVRALLLIDEREPAARLLVEWLDSNTGNPVAEHMLASCRLDNGAAVPERASDRYVQQVFDGFTGSFGSKLEALEYQALLHVAQALAVASVELRRASDIVDAGNGTGLWSRHLRLYAYRSVGCDLSVGMLRRAKATGSHDVLHQAEPAHYLATQFGAFDALVFANPLCYFDELETALVAARTGLSTGGWQVFMVKALPSATESGHRLQGNGRYAPQRSYLLAALAAAELEIIAASSVELWLEVGRPIKGRLLIVGAAVGMKQI